MASAVKGRGWKWEEEACAFTPVGTPLCEDEIDREGAAGDAEDGHVAEKGGKLASVHRSGGDDELEVTTARFTRGGSTVDESEQRAWSKHGAWSKEGGARREGQGARSKVRGARSKEQILS